MSRIRMAATAVMVACGLMLVAGSGVANAQDAARLTQVVPMSGTVTKGGNAFKGKQFTGTYTIERFVSSGGKLYSVGTLKGKVGKKKVTKRNVRMPAALAPNAQASQILPTPGACTILNLQLGPIDLNLLGLRVRTNQINALIEGVPGAGNLLGNLLCGITGILDPQAATPATPSVLTQVLNALLALVPRTA